MEHKGFGFHIMNKKINCFVEYVLPFQCHWTTLSSLVLWIENISMKDLQSTKIVNPMGLCKSIFNEKLITIFPFKIKKLV